MWALIQSGAVAEITDIDPTGRFHPSVKWAECSTDVKTGWGYDGAAFTPPPGPDYAELRERALTRIDTAAGKARLRYVSAGQLIEEEYRQALHAVQAWRDAGSPADAVPAEIISGAEYSDITHEQAAVEIEQTATAWEGVLSAIRDLRLGGKAAVKAAADDEIESVTAGYIEQLEAMSPAE